MSSPVTRRDFVAQSAALGAVACAGDFAFLKNLPSLSAQDVRQARAVVGLESDIEPLVRFIEETPRDRLLEGVGQRIRGGTSYQELLAALMLAGVRGIKPRPNVGFKFHSVMVVNSAHLASLAAADRDRWLPLFWSLDNFKRAQDSNRSESGDWRMSPVAADAVPAAHQARDRFNQAMDSWNEEGADGAAASLARGFGAAEVQEIFWRYGARDLRDIGHKAIYTANAFRTIHTISWRHAEPILRSLAFAILKTDRGQENPSRNDYEPDRDWRENLPKAARIRAAWRRGRVTAEAGTDLLATLRTASSGDACTRIVEMLNAETDPSCIWDGLFLMGGELLMRSPNIVGLHTLTTMNALHYGYQATGNDETRRMLMLQGAAFLVMFRRSIERNRVPNHRIDRLERAQVPERVPQAVEEIFASVTGRAEDKMTAARKTLGLLHASADNAGPIMAAARRLIFSRGTDSHDYKFSSAVLEDFHHTSAAHRQKFMAASMFWLKGSGGQETALARRTRAALTNGN
jgi:hypothetical protein